MSWTQDGTLSPGSKVEAAWGVKRQTVDAAHAAGSLRAIKVDATRLLRLTRFPKTEPYWGKGKVYRFDQKKAAEIFGGEANAFSRDETGHAKPPLALVKLLKVPDRHPDLLTEIRTA